MIMVPTRRLKHTHSDLSLIFKIKVMKKINLLYIVSILLITGACQKELEIEPHEIYYENFYQSEDDALNAINAVYDVLAYVDQYSSNLWLIQDISSDDCNTRATLNDPNLHEFHKYNLNSTNIYLAGVWQASYLGISRANIVLARVPPIVMDSVFKDRILGEARFLRAQFYFNLARMFGDIPLVLKPVSPDLTDEELYPSRTDLTIVYQSIVDDLNEASTVLPTFYTSDNKGRATQGAAQGLLASVYLHLGNWTNASETAAEVIGLGVYELWQDYTDNFKEAKKNGMESVFEVQFYRHDISQHSQMVISGLPSIPGVFPAGVEIMLPTEDLLNSFEAGDYRFEATFFDEFWFDTFDPHIWKFWDQDAYDPDETSESGANFMVMRYSEILLIYAEALNEANGGPTPSAYDAINQVRERARNGQTGVLPDLAGLTQDEFREAVLMERRHEFVNEGKRWFDLVRTNNLVEFVNRAKGDQTNPQDFNYLFPIPQRELDINTNLIQNPGY